MDDGTARFEKGLEDSATSVADLTASTAFYVSGTQDGNNNAVFLGRVGIGTATPDYALHVAGNIGVDQYVYHNGDSNTHINFADDKIVLKAGNKAMITMEEKGTAPHEVTINDGGNNIDFVVKGNGSNEGNPLLMCDASTGRVGINGVGSPAATLHVGGTTDSSLANHGLLVLGPTGAENMTLDQNEIIARNNGAASTLAADGGNGGGDAAVKTEETASFSSL